MLPVWDIITRGADDGINTAKIGNILATSCFYSATIMSIYIRLIACARLNREKSV